MKHLRNHELVDLLEARETPERREHAEQCDVCRARLDALRATLADVQSDEAPAPSPLFWEYFGARVSAAIRDEVPAAPEQGPVSTWLRSPIAHWAAAAFMALLVMVTVVWRATLHAPGPVGPPAIHAIDGSQRPDVRARQTSSDAAVVDDVDADEAWAVVRSAAEGLRWEDAHAAGITPGFGSAEGLALELSDAERTELARLIQREMKRPGA